jgi:hypothetical protein
MQCDASDDQLRRLKGFVSVGFQQARGLTPKRSGPHCRPGRVSDAWALGGGVLLILLSFLIAALLEWVFS